MTETQSIYKSNSLGLENQNREIALGHCKSALCTKCSSEAIALTPTVSELIHCGTITFEPASKGTYRVLAENTEYGRIFITNEGTWRNTSTDKIYGTPYEAATGLFETCIKPISISQLLDKPFDELTVTEWELLKASELQTLNGVPA